MTKRLKPLKDEFKKVLVTFCTWKDRRYRRFVVEKRRPRQAEHKQGAQ